ncbi:MAG: SDR family oxidoreductase [Planctomycetota bacterium]
MAESPGSMPQWNSCRAVITGASSGIGQSTAIEFGRRGCRNLVLHYRSNETGIKKTQSLLQELGPVIKTKIIQADFGLGVERDRFIDAVFGAGEVDVWINNAGADVLTGEAAEQSFEQKLHRLWNVDVAGTIDLSRKAAARMRQAGSKASSDSTAIPKSMVFIGWDQANHGMEGDAGQMFGPIKAAVMAFAHSMAQEHAPEIRINCVAPGWIQTAWGETTEGYWDKRARQQALMKRWGRPEDVAETIAYAANPANTFLTGQTLNVNGGFNRRYDDS